MRKKDYSVVPPTYTIKDFIEKVGDATKEEIFKKAEADDEKVIDLLSHPSWEKFKELAEERIAFLKEMVDPDSKEAMISLSDTPEIIGTKYLIISFAVSQIRQLINLPETINEARRIAKGTTGTEE